MLVAMSQLGYIDDITDYNVKSASVFSFLVEMSCVNCFVLNASVIAIVTEKYRINWLMCLMDNSVLTGLASTNIKGSRHRKRNR